MSDEQAPAGTDEVAECGTYAAYQRHKKLGEPLDDRCREANAAYQREYRKTHPDAVEAGVSYGRARHRALEQLAREHRARFQELFKELRSAPDAEDCDG